MKQLLRELIEALVGIAFLVLLCAAGGMVR
jgi:hypothetical protein